MIVAALLLQAAAPAPAPQQPATPPAAAPAAPAAASGPSAPVAGPDDGYIRLRVAVDARSGPWVPGVNPGMPFGTGNAAPPVSVTGFAKDGLDKITIVPTGTTTVDGVAVPSTGMDGKDADDRVVNKVAYPSYYAPKLLYPIFRHALIGVFADETGRVMGRPFPVGTGIRVPIPENAHSLLLGFNDITSAGASGALQVIVKMPEP